MSDILILIFALLALGLFVWEKWFRYRNPWKGHRLIINGEQIRHIIAYNKTTLTVDKPFETDTNSKYIIK